MKKRIALILPWPELLDVHLIKDVGLFPCYLANEYCYDVQVITYDNKKSGTKLNEWRNLNIVKLQNMGRFKDFPHMLRNPLNFNKYLLPFKRFIKLQIDNFDIFMFFHANPMTLILCKYIRSLNKNVKIYVKGDKCSFSGVRDKIIFSHLLGTRCYFSTENKNFYDYLINSKKYKKFSTNFILAPNGIDDQSYEIKSVKWKKSGKEKILLAVGRFGALQKNSELILRVLERIKLNDWKMIFAGPLEIEENHFDKYLDNWYKNNPSLKKKVLFLGNISDREKLYQLYSEASVFLMPSRWESFGLAFLEAAYFGDYIISTDVGAARELVEGATRGFVVPDSTFGNQNEKQIEDACVRHIQNIIDEKINLSLNLDKQEKFINKNYLMSRIVKNEGYERIFR